MVMKKNVVMFSVAGLFILLMFAIPIVFAAPSGGSLAAGSPQTAPSDPPGSDANAYAGNVTYLGITGFSTTRSWQGYFGNVSGTIELTDNQNNTMYNWSLVEPSGEVYASTNSSFTWTNIQCFNFTANATFDSEAGNGGTTNLRGRNLTGLETLFNISTDDIDGVNETFAEVNHDLFYTASQQFSANECPSTHIFDSTGKGVDTNFEEVLLYEPVSTSIVFTALLEEGVLSGFNAQDNDFEMLVLENGHGTDIAASTYYFWVELE